MAEEVGGRSAMELVREVWSRRKWLAVAAFVVPFTASMSVIAFLPNVYRSTVTVLVDRQQVPEAFVRPTVTSALETRLQTISQEILSRTRLNGLIDRFSLYGDLRRRVSPEDVVERMRRDIRLELKSVEQREGRGATVAFALSYMGRDPEKVAQVTNTLASFYIEENLKARERQATGTAEFLKSQLATVKARLDEQERVLSDFKKRHLGELPQQLDTHLATIERLSAQLAANADAQVRAKERRGALLRQLAESGALVGTGPEAIEEQITKLRQDLTHLRARYSDKYPDVVTTRATIAALERELAEKRKNPPPKDAKPEVIARSPGDFRTKQALSEMETEISILKGDEQRMRRALAAYLGRVENVPKREQEFKELSRDYETTRETYASLLKRYEEAQLAESMEQRQKGEQFRVLDSAVPGGEPTAPNRGRLVGMALALSLGLAVAAIIGAEQLNAAFHSADDLRAFTSVPLFVSIPRIVTPEDQGRSRSMRRLAVSGAILGLVAIVGISYWFAHGNEQIVTLLPGGRF